MDAGVDSDLRGRRILIVESETRFLHHLETALEEQGAETLAVTDPYSFAGAERITRFVFSAAVINEWYRRVQSSLRNMPVVIYGGTAPVPAQVDVIVRELKSVIRGKK